MAFVHGHVHSEFSALDGMVRLNAAFQKAKEAGQTALAITDHGTLGGIWKARKFAKETGVKLIPGVEVYVAIGSRFEKNSIEVPIESPLSSDDACSHGDDEHSHGIDLFADEGLADEHTAETDAREARGILADPDSTEAQKAAARATLGNPTDEAPVDPDAGDAKDGIRKKHYWHLTLLARNAAGWQNLIAIQNEAFATGIYYKPRIDFDLLKKHSEGIIALTGCLGGVVAEPVGRAYDARNRSEEARGLLRTIAERVAQTNGIDMDTLGTALVSVDRRFESVTAMLEEARDPEGEPVSDAERLITQEMLDFHRIRKTADERVAEGTGQARGNIETLIEALGHENVYIEVMEHGIPSEQAIIGDIAALADEYKLPLFASNDAHYLEEADHEAHEAWLAMQSKSTLADPKRYRFTGHGFFLRTEEQMRALREDTWWQDAVSNTQTVADRVEEDIIPDPAPRMPRFQLPEGETRTSRQFMIDLIFAGAAERYGANWREERPDVKERLNYEFKVIDSMGFLDYFGIVWDVISWARSTRPVYPGGPDKKPILVGPGRGSAAGSLVSYCLRIVNVDPLEYNLLFERFLEPGRPDWPDIDMDYEKSRLDEVLAYMMHKWGVRSVARIGSFAISKSRASIKNAARVLGVKGGAGDKLSKLVPVAFGQPWPIEKMFDETKAEGNDFRKQLARFGDDGERIIDLASKFEGLVTGVGIHACGVVVADIDLDELVPLRQDTSKIQGEQLSAVTAWDSKDIEAAGLLKLDFLSLRTLDIISLATEHIQETTGEVIDPDDLPNPNDLTNPRVAAAYRLLVEGKTSGIFQSESAGMTKVYQNIQPSGLEDLSAVVALFRPGPLAAQMDVRYADRKHGRESVTYDYITLDKAEQEVIDGVLGVTYGTTVYQEQIMQLSRVVAGFDAKLSNKMRKAMGKKLKEVMDEVEVLFIEGAQKNVSVAGEAKLAFKEATARRLWDLLKGNADYLFNKSHSVAYAQVAFITAYLKANWPAEFGAAVLATTEKKESRVATIRSLTAEGIEVLAPSVNKSRPMTFPEGSSAVRLGLTEIKGLGSIGEAIYKHRVWTDSEGAQKSDPYHDLRNVAFRVKDEAGKSIQVNHLEALVESGACDEFGPRMGQFMVCRTVVRTDMTPLDMEWGPVERASRQRARLYTSLGEHPLTTVQPYIKSWRTPDSVVYGNTVYGQSPLPIGRVLQSAKDGDNALTLGLLAAWSERTYAGGRMANITLEGSGHSIDCVIWDGSLTEIKAVYDGEAPMPGSIIAISGRVVLNLVEVEDDEGNVSDISKKEMMVTKAFPVPIPDAPVGELKPCAISVPVPMPLPEPVKKTRAKKETKTEDTQPTLAVGVIDAPDIFDDLFFADPSLAEDYAPAPTEFTPDGTPVSQPAEPVTTDLVVMNVPVLVTSRVPKGMMKRHLQNCGWGDVAEQVLATYKTSGHGTEDKFYPVSSGDIRKGVYVSTRLFGGGLTSMEEVPDLLWS
jgi:DNA polymerase-3 subunit alpha